VNLLEVHWWHWVAFALLVVALLTVDLLVFHRRIHTPTLRESAGWSVFWIALALVFNALLWWWGVVTHGDSKAGLDFLAAYLVEKSLSMDNLFVFAVIFHYFHIPLKYQYRVLHWGILGAIVLRLAFILGGVELIRHFEVTLAIFGAFLVYTGVKLALARDAEVHPERNFVLRTARRLLRVTRDDHGQQFFAREAGRLCITPMFLVLLVIESSDVLFAVDSVPAVLGITHDAFIAFTSNVFAILGLRALYFLLAGVMDRFRYFHYGLSAVLVFIGVKMIGEYAVKLWSGGEERVVPSWVSLLVVAALLAISIAASIAAKRRENRMTNNE
jgi:tellurite resistance protein TerC